MKDKEAKESVLNEIACLAKKLMGDKIGAGKSMPMAVEVEVTKHAPQKGKRSKEELKKALGL